MEEIQDLSKQTHFNNSTYSYKSNTSSKTFIGFKGRLSFLKNYLHKARESRWRTKNI